MAQQVRDPMLPLLWLRLLLWCGFDPWPGNAFHMLQRWQNTHTHTHNHTHTHKKKNKKQKNYASKNKRKYSVKKYRKNCFTKSN